MTLIPIEPSGSTSINFWRMVWQTRARILILIDPSPHKYWPEKEGARRHEGDIAIRNIQVVDHDVCKLTKLILSYKKVRRGRKC